MKPLASGIFRQRLLIEGFYTTELIAATLKVFLQSIAAHFHLQTYGKPVIFAPASGMGKAENQGFDAFQPLIDSGISAYIWSGPKLFLIVLYTCKGFDKGFDEQATIASTKDFLRAADGVVSQSF